MIDFLKKLNDENYANEEIYCETKEEAIKLWGKYLFKECNYCGEYEELEEAEEYAKRMLEWNGSGDYCYQDGFGNDFILLTEDAITQELERLCTKKNDFPILDGNTENIQDEFLDYIDDVILDDEKFKKLQRFDVTFKIIEPDNIYCQDNYLNFCSWLENNLNLEEKFTELFEGKENIYHQYNIWDRFSTCNGYEYITYIYACNKKDIENLITGEFESLLEENNILMDI